MYKQLKEMDEDRSSLILAFSEIALLRVSSIMPRFRPPKRAVLRQTVPLGATLMHRERELGRSLEFVQWLASSQPISRPKQVGSVSLKSTKVHVDDTF